MAIRLNLPGVQYTFERIKKQIRIIQGPEIDIQCMQTKEVPAFIARISAGQMPFMSVCTCGRLG